MYALAGTTQLQKRLKPTAVPSIFPWTQPHSASSLSREAWARKRLFSVYDNQGASSFADMDVDVQEMEVENDDTGETHLKKPHPQPPGAETDVTFSSLRV